MTILIKTAAGGTVHEVTDPRRKRASGSASDEVQEVYVKAKAGNTAELVYTRHRPPTEAPILRRVSNIRYEWSEVDGAVSYDWQSFGLGHPGGTASSRTGPRSGNTTNRFMLFYSRLLSSNGFRVRARNADGPGPWSPYVALNVRQANDLQVTLIVINSFLNIGGTWSIAWYGTASGGTPPYTGLEGRIRTYAPTPRRQVTVSISAQDSTGRVGSASRTITIGSDS